MFLRVPVVGEPIPEETFAVSASPEIERLCVESNQEMLLSLSALREWAQALGAKLKKSPHLAFHSTTERVTSTSSAVLLVPLDTHPEGEDGPSVITDQILATGIIGALQRLAQGQELSRDVTPAGINGLIDLTLATALATTEKNLTGAVIATAAGFGSLALMVRAHLVRPEELPEHPDMSGTIPPVALIPAKPPYPTA